MPMKLLELHYGFWAQMRGWPVAGRAALVIALAFIVIYIFLMPLLLKLIFWLARLVDLVIKGVYWGIVSFAEIALSGRSQTERSSMLNRISGIAEALSSRVWGFSKKAAKKKRISYRSFILLYFVLISAIALPEMLRSIVNENYMPAFSVVNNGYRSLEQGILEKAEDYPPLFKKKERKAEVKEDKNDLPSEEEKIMLSLSKEGRGGSNIRAEASAKSSIILTVSGDAKMLYLQQESSWVYVRLEDGREGWIKDSLVEGLPKE